MDPSDEPIRLGGGWLRRPKTSDGRRRKDIVILVIREANQPIYLRPDLDHSYGELIAVGARYGDKTPLGRGEIFAKDGGVGLIIPGTQSMSALNLRDIDILVRENEMIRLQFVFMNRKSQRT